MRIDRLTVQNFKKFSHQVFSLHPQFTLLIGDNGSGKTSILDALAVAMAIWLVDPPDSTLRKSGRNIQGKDIRLEATRIGDRVQFREQRPTVITAEGTINRSETVHWTRQEEKAKTSKPDAKEALNIIRETYKRDSAGQHEICPVLAYYGAGRAWLPSKQRFPTPPKSSGPARRWDAFYECFNERIRFEDLERWFLDETTAAGTRKGRMRPGFQAVRRAVLGCIPGAGDIWFDADRREIVLSIEHTTQPLSNLSAGQKMILALVADIAIKAVTQNAFLLPPESQKENDVMRVLHETPGIVLIDELDVHLHPLWQRRVATDLKRTFPSLQFVCTSHSPQVIGELSADEISNLDEDATHPGRAFGIDSSRILEEVMHTPRRNEQIDRLLTELAKQIDREEFEAARTTMALLETKLGPDDPELTRAGTLMAFLEQPS